VVEFIEIGEDDLPVAPVTPPVRPTPMAASSPLVHRVGRPRTADGWAARASRQNRNDQRAIARGDPIKVADPATAPDIVPEDVIADTDDLAATVVRRTMKQMAAGKLQPTLRDGLTAQQLLDRRAEKAADRSFMLNLAAALAGGGSRTPIKYLPNPQDVDPDIIEGSYSEENLAPDHLRQG
jgi:hypothetical protein